ncbi:MAG: hypothetical protein V3S32_11135 [Acidimicrobiia bacterium]
MSGYRLVVVAVILIRLGALLLSATAVVIAAVPILVLVDLLDGGTGYGLCPSGLEACDSPYSTAAELAVLLTLALATSVLGIRLLMRLARRLQNDSQQTTR